VLVEETGSTGTVPAASTRAILIASVLFCISGVAALVYQVTWQRILALHSGVGVYSVAMIVGAFMAGLGLGSHAGGALSTGLRPRRALGVFGLLELAIGLFGAASCLLYYDFLYPRAAWLYDSPFRAGLSHFFALLLPTGLMGMSLPFLVQAMVREPRSATRTIGTLYGLNVVGAAIGALVTPWFLIRYLGIRQAIFAGVACNLLAALGALLLYAAARGEHDRAPNKAPALPSPSFRPPESGSARSFTLWILLYTVSGFCALSLEIVWFRVVDVAVRSTAFTFGSVLAIYLLGLAGGCLLGARSVERVARPLRAFLLCQCLLLLYAATALHLLAVLPTDLPGYKWYFNYWGPTRVFQLGGTWELGRLLPLYGVLPIGLYGLPTVLMGFSFAVLQRAVQDDPKTSGRKVGFLQAANIAGNVAGSLIVGLLTLQALGTMDTMRLLLACGLLFALVGMRQYGLRSVFSGTAAALTGLLFFLAENRDLWLRMHGLEEAPALIEEDATAVVAIKPESDFWRVMVNGKRHSWLPYGGVHSLLGALPAVVHPAPREVAIIGLGSGDTAWAAAGREDTRRVTVFEIAAPQQRLLTRYAELERDREKDRELENFLGDRRVEVIAADGRNALFSDDALYDVIVVDALLPTSAYSGNVYSVEFFEGCARKLKPGGIMSTWAPTPRVGASFRAAFPFVLEARDGTLLLGSIHPIQMSRGIWLSRLKSAPMMTYLGPRVLPQVLECLQSVTPGSPPPSNELELNHDLFPRDEFRTPR
jgi:predicted membrane-bound spermidine synthase